MRCARRPIACLPDPPGKERTRKVFSARSVVLAVVVAFLVGIVASLAVRPPGERAPQGTVGGDAKSVRDYWRVALSAPRSLPGSGETLIWLADTMGRASNGAFVLDLYDPGEIVPAFSITEAVRDGKLPAGITWLGYDQGRIPASAPFGLDPWAYIGWWFFADGRALAERIYGEHHVKSIFCAIS